MTCWRCGGRLIVADEDDAIVRRASRPKCLLCGRWQTADVWRPAPLPAHYAVQHEPRRYAARRERIA